MSTQEYKLKDVCLRVQKTNKQKELAEEQFTYVDIASIDNNRLIIANPKSYVWSSAPSRAQQIIAKDDIVFSTVRPYLKNIAQVTPELDGAVASTGFCVIRANPKLVLPRLLFYYVTTNKFIESLNIAQRGTSYPAVRDKDIMAQRILLPDLVEQEKIVTKIEELFSELENNILNLKEGLDHCEALRASIIERAYSKASFKRVRLSEITKVITDGDHQAPPKSDSGVPFIVISNIINNRVALDRSTRYVPETYYNNLKDTRKARTGDVLYTVTGSYGIPALIESDDKFCFQRHIALLRPDMASVSSKYLFYALQTDSARNQAAAIATGTAQLTVPLTGLRKIEIPLAPLDKQKKLIEQVEMALTELEGTTAAIRHAIALAKNIKQSILSKAFKGELV